MATVVGVIALVFIVGLAIALAVVRKLFNSDAALDKVSKLSGKDKRWY